MTGYGPGPCTVGGFALRAGASLLPLAAATFELGVNRRLDGRVAANSAAGSTTAPGTALHDALHWGLCTAEGRDEEPSAAVIDSQSVTTTARTGKAATTPARR